MAKEKLKAAFAYLRTSSAANVGVDKDSANLAELMLHRKGKTSALAFTSASMRASVQRN